MSQHNLASLLHPWMSLQLDSSLNTSVKHMALDSRRLQQGDVFIAVNGHAVDGRQFIDAALTAGASAVIADADDTHPHGSVDIQRHKAVIYFADLSQHLSALAGRLYQSQDMRLIAVTGTNGKTTISQLIAQWLELLGQPAAVMGTTGNGFLNNLQTAANTTGSAVEIQHTLQQLQQQGAQYTALEVSSHGLVQGRVKALNFQAGIFTNLSRDHLDYHGTMQAYADAKLSLFTQHQCRHKIINADDAVGLQWLQQLQDGIAVSLQPISVRQGQQALWAESVLYSEQGVTIALNGSWGGAQLRVPLIGSFNASNLLLALATLLALGLPLQQLVDSAPNLTPVIGRMELFQSAQSSLAKVVVDYAHTPDALEKALQALRVHCHGKLWVIFGCGGDRDKGKRPMMTAVAEQLADKVIITDDNPRGEDAQLIVADMLQGAKFPQQIKVLHSRYAACQFALQQACAQDVILLAGKGHEDYQIIGRETLHYSDRETAQQLLGLAQ